MAGSVSAIIVRRVSVFELPKLLRFKARNDFHSPLEGERQAGSLSATCLHILRHCHRLVSFGAYDTSGRIVGYATLVCGGHRYAKNIHLANIAVDEQERGRGVGTLLFQKIEDFAKEARARRLELEVFSSNDKAIALYKRLGYDVEGLKRRVVERGADFDDLVLMAKLLG